MKVKKILLMCCLIPILLSSCSLYGACIKDYSSTSLYCTNASKAVCDNLGWSRYVGGKSCGDLGYEEDEVTTLSGGSGGGSSSNTDALNYNQVTYSYKCSTSGSTTQTIKVSNGPCKSSQQNYAKVFSCNEVGSFKSACTSYYTCCVNNSTGTYKTYYKQYLDFCKNY